mgnify:CR=1 FL=1|jgi:rhamnose transport system substrate-binding protein
MKLKTLTAAVLGLTVGLGSVSFSANADTVLFVGKMRQESFWNAMEAGAAKAASDLGVELIIQGDPSGSESAAKQVQYIESGIDRGVNAIACAAIDENTTDSALQAAMAEGIKVIGFDSDPGLDSRDYFVNQADPHLLAVALVEDMVKGVEKLGCTKDNPGLVYMASTFPTTPNQNTWIENIKEVYYSDYTIPYNEDGSINFDLAKKQTKSNKYTVRPEYAAMKLGVDPDDDIIYGGLDHATSKTQISNKLTANPDTRGILVLTTNAGAASYDSIMEKGLQGKTIFNGICVPTDSKSYLESGVMTTDILWQPYDLGYLVVNAAVDAMKGEIKNPYVSKLSGTAQVEGQSVYDPNGHRVQGTEIFLGAPALYTKDTADKMKQ